jgi:hypothetical protein
MDVLGRPGKKKTEEEGEKKKKRKEKRGLGNLVHAWLMEAQGYWSDFWKPCKFRFRINLGLRQLSISHVGRDANNVAYLPAKETSTKEMDYVWLEDCPNFICARCT